MSFHTHKGSFSKSTGGAPASQAVTGVGFRPKALILWATRQTSTGIAAHFATSYGFFGGGGTNHTGAWQSEDGQGTSDADKRLQRFLIMTILDTAGATAAEASLTSFDSDGFTLSWTTNDANAYIIHYLALGGGGLRSGYSSSFTSPASAGNQSETGVGFQPDAVLFLNSVQTSVGTNTNIEGGLGFAVSNSERGAISHTARDASGTSSTSRYQRTNKCIATQRSDSKAVLEEADFVSMDADGFTVNWTTANASSRIIAYLALKGGRYFVGNETQRTSTGTRAKTGVGFTPTGILAFSVNATANASVAAHDRIAIGGASAAGTEGATWAGDTDSLATTSADQSTVTDKVLRLIDTDGPAAADAEADLDSFDADGFTLDWTTADAVAREFVFICFGTPASTTVSAVAATATAAAPIPVILANPLYQTFGSIQRLINPGDYASGASIYFEVILKTSAAARSAHARLYNVTDGGEVASSELSTQSETATRLRSSALSLAAGDKLYRADFGGVASGDTYTCYAADVLVDT